MVGTRTAAAVAAGVAAVAALVVTGPQAYASPLSVSVSCESGASQFLCVASTSGGTAPYTTTWTAVANAHITHPLGVTARGTCTAPGLVQVRAEVTDATGAQVSDTGSVGCNSGPWP